MNGQIKRSLNQRTIKRGFALAALATCTIIGPLHAETIYVDFGVTANTTPESYNEISPSASGPNTSLDEPNGEDFTNLVDTNNVATGIDLNVMVTSDVGDARAGPGPYVHDPISGISSNALNDGLWLNNGNVAPNTFGFRLTFTGLPSERYDINLAGGEDVSINNNWRIATGTGDNKTNTITAANDQWMIANWRGVMPVDGTIVIESTANATAGWKNQRLDFVSLSAAPMILIGWHTPTTRPDTTPDICIEGVSGALSGGQGIGGNCTDNTYGAELGTALYAVNAITVITGGSYEMFLSVTNNTEKFLVLETIHFDFGRWWPNSPQDVALYYDEGDLAAADDTLINSFSGATPLNATTGDFDDFDWALKSALGDITLSTGEGATFRFVASNSNEGSTSSAFDNIAITGYLTHSKGTTMIVQ